MNQLAWGAKVGHDFRIEVLKIVTSFGWERPQASDLMACIAFESGETFSPSIKNAAGSGATGLIQFMPKTAIGLGTTVEALAKMSAVEQLEYVYLYFKPYAKRVKNLPDMYMAILLPSMITKAPDAVLFSGGVAYRQNSGLDSNKDGIITKSEASQKVIAKLSKGLKQENVFTY